MTKDEESLLKEKYNGDPSAAFMHDCVRLRNGEPLAYVVGWVPFLHTVIHLDSRPLIPRPETEFWVEKVLKEMEDMATLQVLDLCAGSGCIGVSVLKALPHARVDFIELEERHHETIRKNVLANIETEDRSRIVGGDLLERADTKYDCILSNPPYIDESLERVEESVQEYEPSLALYGGEQGMKLIEQILRAVPGYLTDGGVLYIEHEPEQVPLITAIAKEVGLMGGSFPDQYGILRYSRFALAKGK